MRRRSPGRAAFRRAGHLAGHDAASAARGSGRGATARRDSAPAAAARADYHLLIPEFAHLRWQWLSGKVASGPGPIIPVTTSGVSVAKD